MTDSPAAFISADGWYLTHPDVRPNEPRIFYRVALWRVEADGTILGMIPVVAPASMTRGPAKLYIPPTATGGVYVHI
ncbi:MAG: hypothetical protein WKG03_01685, partial [Telluria sp.]